MLERLVSRSHEFQGDIIAVMVTGTAPRASHAALLMSLRLSLDHSGGRGSVASLPL